ncbi:DUF3293 domain-containing protein [Paraburkholderia caribensis]|uniref:DUF3293 domain-containing protein n=1 Tax=Paraburkholderia caribensis TaxID=75105 RepID=UPI00071F3E33|nr:DUF3293 domain-containing protein [Paraburkholderia caribensis]ALP67921.1 hypothetical protein AN416_35710 [Paraburkholderia caribensis]AUT56129.1 DUF3293 domain-containing protein [Paraburkholderia caribensis]
MFSESQIPRATIQAYLETHYHVHGFSPTLLKIGEGNATLAAIHRSNGVEASAFVTACNPFSEPLDDAANAERQKILAVELAQRGLTFIEGVGQHPSNDWAGEASFLVLGVSVEEAKELGARFGQNAIVWAGSDAVPKLVLLR